MSVGSHAFNLAWADDANSRDDVPLPDCIPVLPIPGPGVRFFTLQQFAHTLTCSSRTRISHLGMLQLGTFLFCMAYLVSPILHFFAAVRESSGELAAGLLLVSALRYCGSTIAYTSVAILVNQSTFARSSIDLAETN